MNNKRFILTAPVLAVAALAFTAAESNAKVLPVDPAPAAAILPEPGPPTYPNYEPVPAVPAQSDITASTVASDDTASEALQAGASGLGGAAIAFAGMWLYRRHQTHLA
ncbi:hypothetical protein [Kribbella shirazensis]|uniref:LPXTG cell wall anchor domain-containing protein n=1 Tax=Kribbella shirazensis TaxID=1105143 RepID=A0A7X6A3F3_9ACTN|nr:hypothetical protein [Kribbella shirazensis]NIK59840.1 hypothetical protein [Kribbella shirazensis]